MPLRTFTLSLSKGKSAMMKDTRRQAQGEELGVGVALEARR